MKRPLICSLILLLSGVTSCSAFPVAHGQVGNTQATLSAHNAARATYHAAPLEWDATLARYASAHASRCQFSHSHGKYGENLAAGYASIRSAVAAWYAERALYSTQRPGFSAKTGHFTQIVWKSTQRVGCGYADCNGKNGTPGRYWVCEYSPAGNVVNQGYFRANVG